MQIIPVISFKNNKKFIYEWIGDKPKMYRGLSFPAMEHKAVTGMFGYLFFQFRNFKNFAVCWNAYFIKYTMRAHVWFDRPVMVLRMTMDKPFPHRLASLGRMNAKDWQFNIIYDTRMNSKVPFVAPARINTLDIYIGVELLEVLSLDFPDLVRPLLAQLRAGRAMSYFPNYLYLTPEMVD